MNTKPTAIGEAAVVLLLEIEVGEARRQTLRDFCEHAFPIYESLGGCHMQLYEDRAKRGRFVEIGYYRSEADYERAERAIKEDPVQSGLIEEWRGLLTEAPKVLVLRNSQETD